MAIVVNGISLSDDEIAREVQYHPAEDLDAARHDATQALVIKTLLVQRARTEGFEQDEEDAIEALLAAHLSVPDPSEERCLALFETSRQRYRAPDIFEASHILLPASSQDEEQCEQAKDKAELLILELQAEPQNFAKLAQEHSACSSSEKGGSLGQFSNGDTVDEFETFLYNLEPGQLCPVPVRTQFGFHVLRLDHREMGRELPFESAREAVREDLLSLDWATAASAFVNDLVANAEISGFEMN